MSSEKKPSGIFKFLNLFDIILILVAIAFIGILFYSRTQGPDAPTADSGTVRYQIELTSMYSNSAELIKPGDDLVDKLRKYEIGTVVDVEVYAALKQIEDLKDGGTRETPLETQQAALITVEASCTQTSSQITVGGGYVIRVGTAVNVVGPGYNGQGYIVGIERGDE